MNNPKVSICIPVYNSAAYLTAAVESALAQCYESFEIIIVDDCSTDGSSDIAAGFAERSSLVRYIVNSTNLGMVPNWNHCLELARGKYIKYLFSDDLLSSPHSIERLAEILDQHPEVTLACSFRSIIDHNGTAMKEVGFTPTGRPVPGLLAISNCLTSAWNYIGEPSSVMFRRQQALRGFHTGYCQMVDLEMWFHLLLRGSIWCEREPLAAFRRHPEQQTEHNAVTRVHIEEILRLYEAYLHEVHLPSLVKAALYYVQCYQVWKGYINDHILSRDQAEQIISHYIPIKHFKVLVPLYKVLNPLRKLILFLQNYIKAIR